MKACLLTLLLFGTIYTSSASAFVANHGNRARDLYPVRDTGDKNILPADIEKKGYLVTKAGDTVYGKVLLKKFLGVWYEVTLYHVLTFKDSTGKEKTYKPGQVRGYGLTLWVDSVYVHLVSFPEVEMTATIGTKKEEVFLLRQVSGKVDVYHLLHTVSGTSPYHYEVPELYILADKEVNIPVRIKPKTLKIPTRYKRSDILPHLKDWPESEYSKINEELSEREILECIISYNNWAEQNKPGTK